MNEHDARTALHELADAARDLAVVCDRDVSEFAATWHAITDNARALESVSGLAGRRSEIASLLQSVVWLFGHHPGSFMEAYVVRVDLNEQAAENAKFEVLKERASAAAGALRCALQ